MDRYKIRLGHTDSVNSIDKENFLDVQLQNTSKKLHFNDIKKTIDQYEQFQLERDRCNRFRLILTINPFCSNVLFNPFTEMVKYDVDENRLRCKHLFSNYQTPFVNGIDGSDNTPERIQMIANTEYSKPEIEGNNKTGFIYYPGYDMFDNHILRNKSFKVVLPPESSNDVTYNTLADTVRIVDGENRFKRKKIFKRLNGLNEKPESVYMHLYSDEDILSFEDSINSNLYEENGWFGFINHSNLITNNGSDVEKVLNNKEACEFIDMYPSRNLFTFNPTYNKYLDRLEYNWDIVLTYPYENVYNSNIVYGGTENALKILSMESIDGPSSEKVAMIRSYVKHNLKRNDTIFLYVGMKNYGSQNDDDENEEIQIDGTDGGYELIEKPITVKNIGDMNGDNEDYFFYINFSDIIESPLSSQKTGIAIVVKVINILLDDENPDDMFNINIVTYFIGIFSSVATVTLNEMYDYVFSYMKERGFNDYDCEKAAQIFMNLALSELQFRFARVVNGQPSKYYIRKFKKIPNLKKRHRDVLPKDLENRALFEEYLNSPLDGNAVYDFDKEYYKLAFAETIYGDECTQITYTDTIDVTNLKDNLGRPLSEIYVTIIKRNVGAESWYDETKVLWTEEELKDIEQSCCFGEVTSGLEMCPLKNDTEDIKLLRSYESDVRLLRKTDNLNEVRALDRDEDNNPIPIKSTNEYFLGDIVEFSPSECKEYVLSEVNYRFNTYQRENPIKDDLNTEMPFEYHEIRQDDYDRRDEINQNEEADASFEVVTEATDSQFSTQKRDEGYYYKSHYKIKLHDFGEINQASHFDLTIRDISPVQSNGIYLKVRTTLPHKLGKDDIVLLCDDKNDFIFKFVCSYVSDKTTFYIMPMKPVDNPNDAWVYFKEYTATKYEEGMTWLAITQYLRDGNKGMCLRRANIEIPEYATKIEKNIFLWREILTIGDEKSTTVPEYPYTNDAFYISKTIDFFLKRQDPDGSQGLYAKDYFPNDVFGKIEKTSNYEYKDEIIPVC